MTSKPIQDGQFSRTLASIAVAVTLFAGLFACASTPPSRTLYTGVDRVDIVTVQNLVGNWSARILNPLEGEQLDSARYSFENNGVWTGQVTSSKNDMMIEMQSVGKWRIEGSEILTTIDDTKVVTDNAIARIMSSFLESAIKKSTGRVNPYEITANRIVWVSEHGQALELTRL